MYFDEFLFSNFLKKEVRIWYNFFQVFQIQILLLFYFRLIFDSINVLIRMLSQFQSKLLFMKSIGQLSVKTHLSAGSFFVFHEAQMRLKVVLVSWQLFPYCLGTSILFLRRRRQNLLERPVVQNMHRNTVCPTEVGLDYT